MKIDVRNQLENEAQASYFRIVKIESNGCFRLIAIPLGEATVTVRETVNGPILYKKEINVELTAPTPLPIIVKKAE